jgi:hypothetical protein
MARRKITDSEGRTIRPLYAAKTAAEARRDKLVVDLREAKTAAEARRDKLVVALREAIREINAANAALTACEEWLK